MKTLHRIALTTLSACLLNIHSISVSATEKEGSDNGLRQQIVDAEWSLRNSSVASTISHSVLDNSLKLLDAARIEIAAGRPARAEQLLSQAARPLYEMNAGALAGKHPAPRQWLNERRETLASIVEASETIALEQRAPTDFAKMARNAIQRSATLEQHGNPDQAGAIIEEAYAAVQQQVARQRHGVTIYLPIAIAPADQQFADGLRRYEERKQITEYLISEAQAEGLDTKALQSGLLAAEKSWQEAAGMAESRHWTQAMASLELAYLRFEDAWRDVGIEW